MKVLPSCECWHQLILFFIFSSLGEDSEYLKFCDASLYSLARSLPKADGSLDLESGFQDFILMINTVAASRRINKGIGEDSKLASCSHCDPFIMSLLTAP